MIFDGTKKDNLQKAAELIKKGGLVGFPTETVYGLGADAFNDAAVKRIFEVKGRPFEDPLILHICDVIQLQLVAEEVSQLSQRLIEKFWPGPLTLILNKTSMVSDKITAGLDTVAVRMPRNIIALALIKNSGTVIAAPSANKFQGISPTTAQHVADELGEAIEVILDGGRSLLGLESTIVDARSGLKVLRLGAISIEDLEAAAGCKAEYQQYKMKSVANNIKVEDSLMAPGMFEFHYAPKKDLYFVDEKNIKSFTDASYLNLGAVICFSKQQYEYLNQLGFKNIFMLSESADFTEAGRNYFSLLREVDQGEYKMILCYKLPDRHVGKTINDRMKKAQHS